MASAEASSGLCASTIHMMTAVAIKRMRLVIPFYISLKLEIYRLTNDISSPSNLFLTFHLDDALSIVQRLGFASLNERANSLQCELPEMELTKRETKRSFWGRPSTGFGSQGKFRPSATVGKVVYSKRFAF